jgi:hypothetical protein
LVAASQAHDLSADVHKRILLLSALLSQSTGVLTNGPIDEARKCALGTRSLGAEAHECSNEETHEELPPSCLHLPSGGGSGKEFGREEEARREREEEAMRIWEEEMQLSVYMPADETLWPGGGLHMHTHGHAVYESWKEDDNTSCDVPMCFRVFVV